MTTRADVTKLATAQRRLVELAKADLTAFFGTLDLTNPAAARDGLLEIVPLLVNEYGDLAATAAAEWFEEVRPAGGFNAQTVDPVSAAQVQGSVRGLIGGLWSDDPAHVLPALTGAMQRYVQYSGRATVARNVQLDPMKPRFARVPTGAVTCAFCEMMASRGFVYLSKDTAGITDNYHDECVVPGTRVTGPELLRGLTREYEGLLVELTTAGGNHLSVTPNHPILTSEGWVPAGELQEGDDLVCASGVGGKMESIPDVDDVPPVVEDVVGEFRLCNTSAGLGVPASAEYLDPKVADGDVDVVDTNGGFAEWMKAAFVQHIEHLALAGARRPLPGHGESFYRLGSGAFGRESLGCPPNGVMRRFGLGKPFFGAELLGSQQPSVRAASWRQVGLTQPSGYGAPSNTGSLGYAEDALAGYVRAFQPFGGRDSFTSALRSVAAEISEDGRSRDAEGVGDVLGSGAGLVHLDNLVLKRMVPYSGHVYNLHTAGRWYTANGILTHNCDCQIVAEWDAEQHHIEGYDPDAMYARYMEARNVVGGDTNAILAEMRRQNPGMYSDGVHEH